METRQRGNTGTRKYKRPWKVKKGYVREEEQGAVSRAMEGQA